MRTRHHSASPHTLIHTALRLSGDHWWQNLNRIFLELCWNGGFLHPHCWGDAKWPQIKLEICLVGISFCCCRFETRSEEWQQTAGLQRECQVRGSSLQTSFHALVYHIQVNVDLRCRARRLSSVKPVLEQLAPQQVPERWGLWSRGRLFCCWGCSALKDERLSAVSSDPLRGGKQMQPIYLKPRRWYRSRPRGARSFTGDSGGK